MTPARIRSVSCWIDESAVIDHEAEYERCFDLDRDAYLTEHVVLGHPTLPGTFVTEIAAEAAVELVSGRVPVAFEDITWRRSFASTTTAARFASGSPRS